jgi:hypothetical protein
VLIRRGLPIPSSQGMRGGYGGREHMAAVRSQVEAVAAKEGKTRDAVLKESAPSLHAGLATSAAKSVELAHAMANNAAMEGRHEAAEKYRQDAHAQHAKMIDDAQKGGISVPAVRTNLPLYDAHGNQTDFSKASGDGDDRKRDDHGRLALHEPLA